MKCRKCKNHTFTIQHIPCCSDCSENGAWNGDKSVYDPKEIEEKDLKRDEVYEDGECRMGTAYGAGCYLFQCAKCNSLQEHLPLSDSC